MDKKQQQLGMNPSTAAHRLRVDLLFQFAIQLGYKCHHCDGELSRDTFSIEHKTAWIDAEDPKAMFFDLSNIGFSHLGCNSRNKRHPHQIYFTEEERKAGALVKTREWKRKNYNAEARNIKYKRTGT
jgi:hypothetical protein